MIIRMTRKLRCRRLVNVWSYIIWHPYGSICHAIACNFHPNGGKYVFHLLILTPISVPAVYQLAHVVGTASAVHLVRVCMFVPCRVKLKLTLVTLYKTSTSAISHLHRSKNVDETVTGNSTCSPLSSVEGTTEVKEIAWEAEVHLCHWIQFWLIMSESEL